jgi:hypothetical protein
VCLLEADFGGFRFALVRFLALFWPGSLLPKKPFFWCAIVSTSPRWQRRQKICREQYYYTEKHPFGCSFVYGAHYRLFFTFVKRLLQFGHISRDKSVNCQDYSIFETWIASRDPDSEVVELVVRYIEPFLVDM